MAKSGLHTLIYNNSGQPLSSPSHASILRDKHSDSKQSEHFKRAKNDESVRKLSPYSTENKADPIWLHKRKLSGINAACNTNW